MNWFFGCVTLLPITVCQLTVGNWIETQERVSCLSQNSFLHSKWKAYKKKTKMISWSALKPSPVPLLLRIPRPEGYVSEYSSDVTSYTRSRPIDICICFIITRSPLPHGSHIVMIIAPSSSLRSQCIAIAVTGTERQWKKRICSTHWPSTAINTEKYMFSERGCCWL